MTGAGKAEAARVEPPAFPCCAVFTLWCPWRQVLVGANMQPQDTYSQKHPGQDSEPHRLELWELEPQPCQHPKSQPWFDDLPVHWLSIVFAQVGVNRGHNIWSVGALNTAGKVTLLPDPPFAEHTGISGQAHPMAGRGGGHSPLNLVDPTGKSRFNISINCKMITAMSS